MEFVEQSREGEAADCLISPRLLWPRVKFAGGQDRVMYPDKWEIEQGRQVVAKRLQMPLILAWSLTIHKCQGMTLDRVQLSLSNIFEAGQAYVALSRCRSLETLQLLDFDPSVVRAHPAAQGFYAKLRSSCPARPSPAPPPSEAKLPTNSWTSGAQKGSLLSFFTEQTNKDNTTATAASCAPSTEQAEPAVLTYSRTRRPSFSLSKCGGCGSSNSSSNGSCGNSSGSNSSSHRSGSNGSGNSSNSSNSSMLLSPKNINQKTPNPQSNHNSNNFNPNDFPPAPEWNEFDEDEAAEEAYRELEATYRHEPATPPTPPRLSAPPATPFAIPSTPPSAIPSASAQPRPSARPALLSVPSASASLPSSPAPPSTPSLAGSFVDGSPICSVHLSPCLLQEASEGVLFACSEGCLYRVTQIR